MADADNVIRSRHNPLVKQIRTLWRSPRADSERLLLLEGIRSIEDAVKHGAPIEPMVLSESFDAARLSDRASQFPQVRISTQLFRQLADTHHPQGILAISRIPEFDLATDSTGAPLLLVLDAIQDPGNLGTLLRSAAAAGASHAYLLPGTVDYRNPKVVRSAMGAHFRIPISSVGSIGGVTDAFGQVQVVAARGDATLTYDEFDYRTPTAIVVGSESQGISPTARAAATQFVAIPMHADTDSLNAAVAGSILLFEAERQRRLPG